jgi:hypothetical protein
LSPFTIHALIYAQNWIGGKSIGIQELEELVESDDDDEGKCL